MRTHTTIAASLTFALTAAAHADILHETFDAGIPAGWTLEDYRPGGSTAQWGVNTDTSMPNMTNGTGLAATIDAHAAGFGAELDVALVSPFFTLPDRAGLALTFTTNFQNMAGHDFAEVDILTNAGWQNLLTWNEDHGSAFTPHTGEDVTINLDGFAGQTVQVRFHYHDPGANDWNWHWQIDEVRAVPAPAAAGAFALLGAMGLRRRRRGC